MWMLAALMLVNEPEPVEIQGFADTYWYSANVSRGKIPFARPILFQEVEVDAVSRDLGQFNFYYAATHSLSDVRDKVCGRFDSPTATTSTSRKGGSSGRASGISGFSPVR